MSKLDAALAYAARGWAVLPLNGKLPAISKADGGRGVHDATTDEDQIRAWWTRNPDYNIGVACGQASGFMALDVDGDEGEESLAELVCKHGALPETAEQSVGECRALRVTARCERDDGKTVLLNLVAAASAETLYIFGLRAVEQRYKKDLEVFERALSTVKFSVAVSR